MLEFNGWYLYFIWQNLIFKKLEFGTNLLIVYSPPLCPKILGMLIIVNFIGLKCTNI